MRNFWIGSLFLIGSAAQASPFVVHEWGTFTSFQGERGDSLGGLHRGDEPLPAFVYLRNPGSGEPSHSAKGCRENTYACDWGPIYSDMEMSPMRATQRMETPVIYFYSPVAQDVSVEVDFPRGIITEWYPSATSFQPAINLVRQLADGRMRWDVRVHTDRLPLPAVEPGSIWEPSRQVAANDISVGAENERLIFYRGVGDFETPFRAASEPGRFSLRNNDAGVQIPRVIYLRVGPEGGFVRDLGSLSSGEFALPYADSAERALVPMDEYLSQATALLVNALTESGLFRDEALAMANTWRHAYFTTPGERFLYVLPRSWTDGLLPMRVQPAPDALERVLVGRVEVMNQARRAGLFAEILAAFLPETGGSLPFAPELTGGFAEQALRLMMEENEAALALRLGEAIGEEERNTISLHHERIAVALQLAIRDL